jgi:NAD/NADP transhydrogenase beta subunit
MSYQEALKIAIIKIIIGVIITAVTFSSFIITILKTLYEISLGNESILKGVYNLLQNMISAIYEHTQFLNILWIHSPKLEQPLVTEKNIYIIIFYYSLLIIGSILLRSGKNLMYRLKKIKQNTEDKIIYDSINTYESVQDVQQFEYRNLVKEESFLNKFHIVYLAPIVVAIISDLILKML